MKFTGSDASKRVFILKHITPDTKEMKTNTVFALKQHIFKALFNHYFSDLKMNVILRGKTKEIVQTIVKNGYANTQSEAIRLAIIDFGNNYLNESEIVNKKLDSIDRDISKGKRKVLTAEQALGKHARHLK